MCPTQLTQLGTSNLCQRHSPQWRSGEIVFIAILGGSGHALGAFIGASVFEFVKLYVAAWLTGSWQLVMGLILLLMVFAAPSGIFGLIERRLRSNGRDGPVVALTGERA